MKDSIYTALKKPILSEKSSMLLQEGCYTFEVDKRLGKIQVAKAVEALFSVKVKACRIVNVRAKKKSAVVNRGRKRVSGLSSSKKKAYVTLAKGYKITEFEGI